MKYTVLGIFCYVQFVNVAIAEQVYKLSTLVSGVVDKVMVKPGENVVTGQILLVLDRRVLTATKQLADKVEVSAKLNLDEIKKELDSANELYGNGSLSSRELEIAKVNFAKAEAKFARAHLNRINAQYQLDYSQITSPVSGKVKSVAAWKGMVVNNQVKTTTLITLVK